MMREQIRRFLDWVRAALVPDNGRGCLALFNGVGLDALVTARGSHVAFCACGLKLAARSRRGLALAVNDHMAYRAR